MAEVLGPCNLHGRPGLSSEGHLGSDPEDERQVSLSLSLKSNFNFFKKRRDISRTVCGRGAKHMSTCIF